MSGAKPAAPFPDIEDRMHRLIHNGLILIPELELADSFMSRAWGLLGRRALPTGRGLLIRPCRSIHTAFMKFPIDVIFLDATWRIVKVVPNLHPWRTAWGGPAATAVVEVQSGWLPTLQPGATLQMDFTA